jgi:hypothetical protein
MSYTSLYKIYKTKRVESDEFRNGHGSGPPVWEYLTSTYIGDGTYWFSAGEKLWALARDKRVPLDVRLCHAFTFDYAIVPPKHFGRMSEACATMNGILAAWPKWNGCVNHWGAFSETFKTLKVDKRCLGVGMRCTSVCDVWDDYPRTGKDTMFDCVSAVLSWNKREEHE